MQTSTNLDLTHYDLVTPDGNLTQIHHLSEREAIGEVLIQKISPAFVGFQIDPQYVFFNMKSVLAQLGLDGIGIEYDLDPKMHVAQVKVKLTAYGKIGEEMLKILPVGAHIGKLFAADERRRVRDPIYLSRMFGRSDRKGSPLLSLGGLQGSSDLILDKVDGRTIAYLTLQNGKVVYDTTMEGSLPTIAMGLQRNMPLRDIIGLHQIWQPYLPRNVTENEILLVRTLPLHIRTVFGRVVPELLSNGYFHTSASVLQPDTLASGDLYELFGSSKREITDIPLEFYTLEPYREHVFFSDRDQLQICLEDDRVLFKAFETMPHENKSAVFIVKSDQLLNLTQEDWVQRETRLHEFPGLSQTTRQALMIDRYIEQQPCYPILKSIEDGVITSQGVLLVRYFPSPLMKRMLLSSRVQRCLKGIYFQNPSLSYGDYFSAEDRALLHDLEKFAIPVYWVDKVTNKILKYVQKPDRESGLFVPLDQVETFLKSTVFGIYGSNLLAGDFEEKLKILLKGILNMRQEMSCPLLFKNTPLSLVTGGGPGAMEVGNRVALELGILSCANIVDFRHKDESSVVNEQRQNPYILAKMTYRRDKLIERQAEFNLDFPIFLNGGIGTDFEEALEEIRRKVGMTLPSPCLLLGEYEYWKDKITSRFQRNLESGTIKGSEWVSNCFYCVETAEEGLTIYRNFFNGNLKVGKGGPIFEEGFASKKDHWGLSS